MKSGTTFSLVCVWLWIMQWFDINFVLQFETKNSFSAWSNNLTFSFHVIQKEKPLYTYTENIYVSFIRFLRKYY